VRVGGRELRTIWRSSDGLSVEVIDQTRLPHEVFVARLDSVDAMATAIATMMVRGAPLIGVAAAYGVCLAMRDDPSDAALEVACARLRATRPTAVNLVWALDEMKRVLAPFSDAGPTRLEAAWAAAASIADADVASCRAMAEHGLPLLQGIGGKGSGRPINLMTHCNAGWLATVDWGTALAPVYLWHRSGLDVHVFVSETRPRNQGYLTEWELRQEGVPCTVIADNSAGHLLQRGEVDAVIVGTDRTAGNGDVCNKIGTYMKALAAKAAGVPFWVAAPSSSIDFGMTSGDDVPIEARDGDELRLVSGLGKEGGAQSVRMLAAATNVRNPAFDVTPAALVTKLITERGVCEASAIGLCSLFPERAHAS